jgi:hypothetical protein
VALDDAGFLVALVKRATIGWAALWMPRNAIEDASLVSVPNAPPKVRVKPAAPFRAIAMLDIAKVSSLTHLISIVVIVSPNVTSPLIGAGISFGRHLGHGLWVRAGGSYMVLGYKQLSDDVVVGQPLKTLETTVPTQSRYGGAFGAFVGLGYMF